MLNTFPLENRLTAGETPKCPVCSHCTAVRFTGASGNTRRPETRGVHCTILLVDVRCLPTQHNAVEANAKHNRIDIEFEFVVFISRSLAACFPFSVCSECDWQCS